MAAPSAEQIGQIKSIFGLWDADQDGIISKQELTEVLSQIGEFNDTEIDQIMERADKNGDGSIQYDEFINWMVTPATRIQIVEDQSGCKAVVFDLDAALRPLFAIYDQNGNGAICQSEFQEAQQIIQGALTHHTTGAAVRAEMNEVDAAFAAADPDGNKRISFNEFVEWQRSSVEYSGLPSDTLEELFATLAEVLGSVFKLASDHGDRKEVQADHLPLLLQNIEKTANVARQLYKDRKVTTGNRGGFVSNWTGPPTGISIQRLLRWHMRVPFPCIGVREIAVNVENVLPEECDAPKYSIQSRRWFAKVIRKVTYNSKVQEELPFYYVYESLQWSDVEKSSLYDRAVLTLAPEYRLLALLYKEVDYGAQLSWEKLNAALEAGQGLGLVTLEQHTDFDTKLRDIVKHMLQEQGQRIPSSPEDFEALLHSDVALSQLQAMSALCEMGIVPHDPLWDDPE